MELNFTIKGELPDLNSYIKAIASNRFVGGKMKQEATDDVAWQVKKFRTRKLLPPYHITFNWFCKDKRKDKDNVSSMGRKVILDALQKAQVIPQDNWNAVDGFSDNFFVDKANPRIEVLIKSLNN